MYFCSVNHSAPMAAARQAGHRGWSKNRKKMIRQRVRMALVLLIALMAGRSVAKADNCEFERSYNFMAYDNGDGSIHVKVLLRRYEQGNDRPTVIPVTQDSAKYDPLTGMYEINYTEQLMKPCTKLHYTVEIDTTGFTRYLPAYEKGSYGEVAPFFSGPITSTNSAFLQGVSDVVPL